MLHTTIRRRGDGNFVTIYPLPKDGALTPFISRNVTIMNIMEDERNCPAYLVDGNEWSPALAENLLLTIKSKYNLKIYYDHINRPAQNDNQ